MTRSLRHSKTYVVGAVLGTLVLLAGCRAGAEPASVTGTAPSGAPAAVVSVTPTPTTTSTARAAGAAVKRTKSRSRGGAVSSPRGETILAGGIVLPNRTLTPGATNPSVTQATIRLTICRTGYTKTIRPSSSYTTSLKEAQLAAGYSYRGDTATGDYEEDHLISLELGGAPSDPRNLWPEPYAAAEGARVKDTVENKLHDLVCSGVLSLAAAQHAIATNWWTALQRYGGAGVPSAWYGRYGTGGTSSGSSSSAGSTGSPSGATAQCSDGTYSYSHHRSGTCSHHGGVARWINPPSS